MRIDLDKAFGIHAQALRLRSQRAEALAGNLANADTPGYKARDLDFRTLLEGQAGSLAVARTDARHLDAGAAGRAPLGYRIPLQPSLDGNTVDTHVEHAAFVGNAIAYQTSLQFLDGRIAGLRRALRGE